MDTRSHRWTLALVGSLAASLAVSAGAPAETLSSAPEAHAPAPLTYRVVDTGQDACFGERNQAIDCESEPRGQDGAYRGPAPRYTDNGDGTITDDVTGLVWQKDAGQKASWDAAVAGADALALGGHDDWRLPTIKELYSLMDFSGATGRGDFRNPAPSDAIPYIDTDFFGFRYGDTTKGERYIDGQFWSSTRYVSTTMHGNATIFGVNFADGRIKGYPQAGIGGRTFTAFVRYVRGGDGYGLNHFVDAGDGTVRDEATGLQWMQGDSGLAKVGKDWSGGLNWLEALEWCEDSAFAGYDDWRLPNAKELHSILDYTRSPDTTNSAAIDPVFQASPVRDENGRPNWGQYWTSTTHQDGPDFAVYFAFGEAQGCMEAPPGSGRKELMDVHGAGSQRSDPKTAEGGTAIGCGRGPQGDVIRVYNLARCVRGG